MNRKSRRDRVQRVTEPTLREVVARVEMVPDAAPAERFEARTEPLTLLGWISEHVWSWRLWDSTPAVPSRSDLLDGASPDALTEVSRV